MPACTMQLYQTCMLGSFIQIHVFVKCFSIRQGIWYVTNPPDMPTGKVQLPWAFKTYQLPAWTPSWIYHILSDASAASLGCYKDDVCNSRISKVSILHTNPWSLPGSGKIFLYLYPPQTLFVVGILFSRCPSVCASVHASICNFLFP